MTSVDSSKAPLSTETGLTDLMTSSDWSLVARLIFGMDLILSSSPKSSPAPENASSTFFWPLEDWESWQQ